MHTSIGPHTRIRKQDLKQTELNAQMQTSALNTPSLHVLIRVAMKAPDS
jgi:hypothetical protein